MTEFFNQKKLLDQFKLKENGTPVLFLQINFHDERDKTLFNRCFPSFWKKFPSFIKIYTGTQSSLYREVILML